LVAPHKAATGGRAIDSSTNQRSESDMTTKSIAVRFLLCAACVAAACIIAANTLAEESKKAAADPAPAATASRSIVACYFHRTNRCDTCKKVGAYLEEAMKTGFAEEMKDGRVELMMVDYENPKNKKYKDMYKITSPTLVIMDARGEKVVAWKQAPDVWSLVAKKDAVIKYVQKEVRAYLEKK
jgi:hypothetical protein